MIATPEVLLSVRDLVVYRGRVSSSGRGTPGRGAHKILEDVSFDVQAGETLGVVGESGCGKSTLALAVLRLIPHQQGSIVFAGQDLGQARKAELRRARRDLQIVFQDPYSSLHPTKLIGSILAEPLRLHTDLRRAEREREVRSLLSSVGLPPSFSSRHPSQCSGGQRQRVAIARALAVHPKLMVLDEPLSALDVSVRAQILQLLTKLQAELGLTYMIISHDLAVVQSFCRKLVVMYLGKVVEYGDTAAVIGTPSHPYTRALLEAVPVPDPTVERRRTRNEVRGEVPSLNFPPSGCRYHTRCVLATDECSAVEPPLHLTNGGTSARCHYWSMVRELPSVLGGPVGTSGAANNDGPPIRNRSGAQINGRPQ